MLGNGFYVEFYRKTSKTFADRPGDNYGELQKALCTKEVLIGLLKDDMVEVDNADCVNADIHHAVHPYHTLMGFDTDSREEKANEKPGE